MEPKYPGCNCDICPLKERQIVPPSGPPDADILFVGQAPAKNEVRLGKPFSGMSGALFDAALKQKGIDRSKVKVDNAILCFWEGGERPPREAVEACKGHLDLKTPKVIVPMGNDALGVTMNIWDGILSVSNVAVTNNGNTILPLTHPAFYLRTALGDFKDFTNGIGLVKSIADGRTPWDIGNVKIVLTDKRQVIDLLNRLATDPPKHLAVDLETDQPDVPTATILAVALAWNANEGYVIPWDSEYLRQHDSSYIPLLEDVDVYNALKLCLEAQQGVLAHNAPFDICLLRREGIRVNVRDDTLLMYYALDERTGRHVGLKNAVRQVFGIADWETELKKYLPNKAAPFTLVPPNVLFPYASMDACTEYALREELQRQFDGPENEGPRRLYNGILMPTCRMFVDTMPQGVRLDKERLIKSLSEMNDTLKELEAELTVMSGNSLFNPNSHIDVADVLFDKLKLRQVRGRSTDKNVLAELQGEHPFVDGMSEFRQFTKVHGTYMVNIAESAREEDGKLRAWHDLKIFGTETGRLSGNRFNPLVFPRESRDEDQEGRDLYSAVKKVIIAEEGFFLLQADYKHAEVRIDAVLSQAKWLLEQLRINDRDHDPHSIMATGIYGDEFLKAEAKRRKELRVIAKMLVFGINYGRGVISIARQLGCSNKPDCYNCRVGSRCIKALKEAQDLYDKYFAPIPELRRFREECIRFVRKNGYYETPTGRRRRFELITDQNIGDITRQIYNFPAQATSNDCNLTSMFTIHKEMGSLTRQLWPIHDSLLMYVSQRATPKDVDDIVKIMMDTPQKILGTDLPFFIDVDVGYRWGELKPYKGVIPEPA